MSERELLFRMFILDKISAGTRSKKLYNAAIWIIMYQTLLRVTISAY